jgi:hypothetical protein
MRLLLLRVAAEAWAIAECERHTKKPCRLLLRNFELVSPQP